MTETLLSNKYTHPHPTLLDYENTAGPLQLYLIEMMSSKKFIYAQNIITFLATPEMIWTLVCIVQNKFQNILLNIGYWR